MTEIVRELIAKPGSPKSCANVLKGVEDGLIENVILKKRSVRVKVELCSVDEEREDLIADHGD